MPLRKFLSICRSSMPGLAAAAVLAGGYVPAAHAQYEGNPYSSSYYSYYCSNPTYYERYYNYCQYYSPYSEYYSYNYPYYYNYPSYGYAFGYPYYGFAYGYPFGFESGYPEEFYEHRHFEHEEHERAAAREMHEFHHHAARVPRPSYFTPRQLRTFHAPIAAAHPGISNHLGGGWAFAPHGGVGTSAPSGGAFHAPAAAAPSSGGAAGHLGGGWAFAPHGH